MNYKHLNELKALLAVVLVVALCIMLAACSDDEDKPKIIPEVTTTAITEFTTTTATGGGEIVSNGNASITASGLVYSSTNTTPVLTDGKTEETATSGIFTSELTGLTSGTPYYVRAYATNSVGTGYGNVVTFITGNAAPTATNVTVTGDIEIDAVLTATYTYADAENDAESGTTYQWYSATDPGGAGEAAIEGATTSTYTILPTDEFKFIRVGVTPKAATGTTTGVEAKSSFTTQVPEAPETVTFIYNGQEVTYTVIVSPETGRKWLDRNLGAQQAATVVDDYLAYGDLFQWGRAADGHQLINWTSSTEGTPVNSTTTELVDSDTPNNGGLFILKPSPNPWDWRDPQNHSLWQGVDGTNNPCPAGWRIPTSEEWAAENIDLISTGFDLLKLPAAGNRSRVNGALQTVGNTGHFWSSTVEVGGGRATVYSYRTTTITPMSLQGRSVGYSCRCIKD